MRKLVITRTPLRISFVGGGSDLPGERESWCRGATISSTINQHVYVVVKRRTDSRVILHWREHEDVSNVVSLKHDLIRESLRMSGIENGIEVVTFADVPGVGSGLGSSAATTVGTLHALYALRGYESIDARSVAEEACRIEMFQLCRSCGRQDQYAVALGGLLMVSYDRGDVQRFQQIGLDDFHRRRLSENFLLFSPRDKSGRNAEEILSKFEDSKEFRDTCITLVDDFKSMIESGSLSHINAIIEQHHELKSKHFPYMSADLEKKLKGAVQFFKLCGAGGSGHLLVPGAPCSHTYLKSMGESVWGPELPFEFVPYGSEVIHVE